MQASRTLSYSSGPGRSFSKGSSQKRDRKKRQEFHKHKVKFTEEQHLDFEQLKARVSVALDKLGHQVFSVEPGGYAFDNWMTSFNLLLDDFEERAGGSNLGKDYHDARLKVTTELVKPPETQDIDWEVQNIDTEINSVKAHMSELSKRVSEKRELRRETLARIDRLKREQLDSEKKFGEAARDLDRVKRKQSLFSKLFSGSNDSSLDAAKKKVDSLKSKREEIHEDIQHLETSSKYSGEQLANEIAVLKEKLESLQQSQAEWNAKKDEISQLSERRLQATRELSEIISSLKLGEDSVQEKASTGPSQF
jgi:DNA repair exonuclease SbcCD ATPase subunit